MPANPRAARRLPTGTVTFLFTDIEGSTKLWEAHPQLMRAALARHDAVMRETIAGADGCIFKTVGDAFCAAFALAPDAVEAVVAAQQAIGFEAWPEETPIRVRMALHTGPVESRDSDYFGPALNHVARLLSTGHGGQTLLSQTTYDLVRDTLPGAVSLHDLGAHKLKDLARPEQVYELRHPDLPRDFPPIKSLSTHPNNLPQQLTSFIGRESAIVEIRSLLGKTRLLTLTGAGGSGKTRLSLQAAADTLEQFPDGAWFVELAALTEPSLVPQALATALGVKEGADKSIVETLTEFLKSKRLLLLLDNCEHLIDASAMIVGTLVRSCPGVKILASSREALGIAGEQVYRVPSLSLPDREAVETPQTLSVYESVRLFIDRARLVRADFQVTNQNAPAVASLCCHLDGIPLAIELAAARVRSLSVEEIDGKLDQRFRLLVGGSRTALPRQQTLRSLIDWSYDLLTHPEQRLLQRLSVFAGGWTLEGAEQVCADEGVADGDVLDRLTSLSDKSLVLAEEAGGHSRYRLLETMRQYARDRLRESGGGEAVRERHRDYFLALAEEAKPKLKGAQQAVWLQRLEDEHDNFRAGLNWSLAEAGSRGGLRLCGALFRFWFTRGDISEGREWCARILGKPGAEERTVERANALSAAGSLAYYQSDYAAAWPLHEEGLAIRRQLGDQSAISGSLNNLGLVASGQGDQSAARVLYEESLAIDRGLGDRAGIASSLMNLGIATYEQGDFASARALIEEGLVIMRELGDRWSIATALGNLADVAIELGDYAAARPLLEESLMIRRELSDRPGIAASLEGLAGAVAAFGSPLRAARIWGSVEHLRVAIGSPLPPYERPRYDRHAAAARAALEDAAAFDRAWQEGRTMTLEQVIEFALQEAVSRP